MRGKGMGWGGGGRGACWHAFVACEDGWQALGLGWREGFVRVRSYFYTWIIEGIIQFSGARVACFLL